MSNSQFKRPRVRVAPCSV